MNLDRVVRRVWVSAAVGMALWLLPQSSTAAGPVSFFTGGGFGLQPEVAIQAAVWDAEGSASAEGLYTCELVGEPQVFIHPHPIFGIRYAAEATLGCTP